ncbi:uncharacterized protein LOC142235302 [Haematobia irritans]|uniref:uncharacterized protein LOC142235302 n=1 Tax=Haematobia irritans TaxID=7368 RepID=UPI003F5009C6
MAFNYVKWYNEACCINTPTVEENSGKVYFLSIHIDKNSFYIGDFIINVNAKNESVDVKFYVQRELPADIFFEFKVHKKIRQGSSYHPLIQVGSKLCKIYKLSQSNILKVLMENLWKRGNFPKQCPIKEGHYYWKDIKPQSFALAYFTGKYKVYVGVTRKRDSIDTISNVTILVEVK